MYRSTMMSKCAEKVIQARIDRGRTTPTGFFDNEADERNQRVFLAAGLRYLVLETDSIEIDAGQEKRCWSVAVTVLIGYECAGLFAGSRCRVERLLNRIRCIGWNFVFNEECGHRRYIRPSP